MAAPNSVLFFFGLFVAAASEQYYIVISHDEPCPVVTCLTLPEVASIPADDNSTTLWFQPGNHSIREQLLISNRPQFRMLSNDTFSANIVCQSNTGLQINEVDSIEIRGLRFIGCSFSSIVQVRNFSMSNSTFESGEGNTALVLNGTTEAYVGECLFLYNTQSTNDVFTDFDNLDFDGEVRFDSFLNTATANFGGAIRSSSSFVVIENSRFEGNVAQCGGAIFAELDSHMKISNSVFSQNWAIAPPNISETESGGGVIHMSDGQLDINNCRFMNNRGMAHPGYSSNGGVLFALNSDISISDTAFVENLIVGNGTGSVMYILYSNLSFVGNCSFIENRAQTAGVIHLQGSNATIIGCEFNRNKGYNRTGVASIEENSHIEFRDCSFSNNSANTLGGVLYVTSSDVSVDGCNFENNSVKEVGAVMAILKQALVNVSSSTVSGNKASLSVLSVYDSDLNFLATNLFDDNQGSLLALSSTIRFQGETRFYNCTSVNRALNNAFLQEGGAISAYSSHLIFEGTTVFVQNSAKYGGALFAVESNVDFYSNIDTTDNATVQLPMTIIDNNSAKIGGGGMYLYHSSLTISDGLCYISGNTAIEDGGGIHSVNSDIIVEPRDSVRKKYSLVLSNNNARLGGGMNLEEASQISASASVKSSILFTENTATYGGALYVDDDTKFDTCFTTPANVTAASECFFRVIDPDYDIRGAILSNNIESITFDNNNASHMGSNLFGGLLDRCVPNTLSTGIVNTLVTGVLVEKTFSAVSIFQDITNVQDLSTISSLPVKICLCVNGQPRCSLRSHKVQARKGQLFTVSVAAVDQVKFPVHSKIFSRLSSSESVLARGQREVSDATCTNITYSVLSPYTSERLSVFADGPCRSVEPSQLTITVTFLPCTCPIGFENTGNSTSCECVCDSLISEFVQDCNVENQTFIRRSGSWIGYALRGNQSAYVYCERCPFRYCQRPPESFPINLNDDTGSDVQCSNGHSGTICGVCSPGYSVSLAHKRCLPCPDNWYIIFIAIVIGTILAGLGLVIGILATNFTVAVGTINGFIFYANIVDVYDSTFLPLSTSSFPVLIIEWLNLDPGLDICFVKGIDLYWHTWVRLIFPAYIVFIIVIIMIISHWSIRFSKLLSKKNPIATLATLLFLSFTNVLETTVVAMRTIRLTYITPNGSEVETVWLPDGEIKYFRGKHIPMFLVAVILVFLTFAYILLLISWQWIHRFSNLWIMKWRKNEKVKRFMEAYNAPYCDKHRYWTGLLLFLRVLLILISIATEGSGPSVRLVSTMFILGFLFLLKMTYAKNLYKQWQIEALETINLFNLFVYALFIWYTLDDTKAQQIIAYISTSIAFVMILCVIACHIYVYLLKGSFPNTENRIKRSFNRIRNAVCQSRSLNCCARNAPNQKNNLEASNDGNGQGEEVEDRYHAMLGTTTLPRFNQQRQPSVHDETPLQPTFTVLETPYIRAERKGDTENTESTLVESFSEISITL